MVSLITVATLLHRSDKQQTFNGVQIVITLLLLVVCIPVRAENTASITLTSATQNIYLGDSVVLDIESTGLLDPLNVSRLKQRDDFLRETTGTRIAVVEGRVVEIVIRRMEFIPTQTGSIVFGPLTGEATAGVITSGSITVEVKAALDTLWQPDVTDLQSEFEFSNLSPVVGEQLIVDVRLRHTHQIANDLVKMPEFSDFDVVPVFEERRTIEDDGQWRQIAWRYLLHPKKSGNIIIGAMEWTGTMIKSRSQRGEFVRTLTPTVLQVSGAPDDRVEWWLPATSVKLTDTWSKDVITLSAGDEIIRTITLTASNVLGSQLPDIAPYPTRALTSTLIRTTRDHELINNHTVATAIFEFRMVAQSPIPVFLDTVRVPWWDVATSTHEEAILPARRINVGLPDRADLLSDLATEQSGWSRLVFKLRSYARWQPAIIALSGFCIFLALLPLLRDGYRQHCLTQQNRKKLRKLEHMRVNRNWTGLYNELNLYAANDADKHGIKTDSHDYQSLIQALRQILFEDFPSESSHSIASVLHKKIQLPFKTLQIRRREPHIPSL